MPRFIVDENLRRTVLDLEGEVFHLGRTQESEIPVLDIRASRKHCKVERHGGDQYVLVDLGSQNGTRLNGHLVDRAPLKPGDEIRVGHARIYFEEAPPPDAPDASTTAILEGDLESLQDGGEGADRLLRFHRIAKALNSELHMDRLLEIIIDHVVELSGAERGFLVLASDEDRPAVRVARNFEQEDVESPAGAFSASIVRQVMKSGEAVLTANAVEDARFSDTLSITAIRARSVMALPFRVRGRIIGAIYVDNRLQKGAFGKVEVETLTSLADLAGSAIERARLYDENERHARDLEELNRRLELRVESTERDLTDARDRLRRAGEPAGAYPQIIGRSSTMRDVLRLLDKIVKTEEPVLIAGESGTGKELIARAVHQNGPRARQPFLSENCAALPDTLLESELFGHVRGSFTGADRDKKGLFELADKGTLFLDEVGDMSPEMQKKLLRALQEGEIRPVGGKSVRKVDVRIISASNKDLDRLVRAGEFREDLYYRMKVLTIRLPPLRQRKEDIPPLVEHFMRLHAPPGRGERSLAPGVLEKLQAYDWPGNIRELENEVKRMLSLGEARITPEDLSEQIRRGSGRFPEEEETTGVQNLLELVEQVERREIAKALNLAQGNKTRAAEMLGISRFTLQRKLDKYDMTE
ncbi:MAG: sigma 54-interacting transcriptional regulator [Planctomycetota bacterium]